MNRSPPVKPIATTTSLVQNGHSRIPGRKKIKRIKFISETADQTACPGNYPTISPRGYFCIKVLLGFQTLCSLIDYSQTFFSWTKLDLSKMYFKETVTEFGSCKLFLFCNFSCQAFFFFPSSSQTHRLLLRISHSSPPEKNPKQLIFCVWALMQCNQRDKRTTSNMLRSFYTCF